MPLFKKSQAKELTKKGDVGGLIALATASDYPSERAEAVNSLARFHERVAGEHHGGVLGVIRAAASDPSAEVRTQALFALGELRPEGAIDRLLAGVEDLDWGVRLFAVTMLGKFPAPRVVARVAAVVADDPEGMVREAAAVSLGELGDPGAIEPLRRAAVDDPEREVRRSAKEALRSLERASS
ncbi:MAG: HEAT repeat domain-containing protein [Actinomycetota bacterium]